MTDMPNAPQLSQHQDVAFSFWCRQAPEDALVVTAFAAEETISGLTRIEALLSSKDGAIDLNALLDTPATLSVHHRDLGQARHFSGVVVEAERGDSGHHRTAYRLTLLPTLYRLDIRSDCRIFQGMSAPDIARLLFAEHGIENLQWEITDTHAPREYCVCYRETLLAFIERIFAEEGVFYFLRHDDKGRHTIVICDRPETLPDCPGQETLAYNAMASGSVKGVYCSRFALREKLAATRFVQRDYTFKAPEAWMEQTARPAHLNGAKQDYELYDYPGRYKDDPPGGAFTRNKIEAVRVDASLVHATANSPLVIAGHAVTLTDHPDEGLNRRWRLLSIRHEGVQPQALAEDGMTGPGAGGSRAAEAGGAGAPILVAPALTGEEATGAVFNPARSLSPGLISTTRRRGLTPGLQRPGAEAATNATLYACAFTAQSSILPYRPPQRRKPLVDGPQIAKVVGPPGEEIYCDEHGRVKVQFPWDRYGKANDTSSCWIRVASNWAGATWGHIAIPRIGHEVIVDFLEGDPDQPIITGRTYHAVNKPPYKLPDNKTRMVIRSDTHKGNGFNEISFEDQVGQEKIYVHGQKDQDIHIENNRAKRIDNNQSESVGHNKSIEVGNNHHEVIGGNMTLMVGPNKLQQFVTEKFRTFTDKIGGLANKLGIPDILNMGEGNLIIGVGKNKAETVMVSSTEIVGAAKALTVGGGYQVTVGGVKNESVAVGSWEEVGQSKVTVVGHKYEIVCGKSKLTFARDGVITLEGVDIFLKTSGGKIHLN